MSEFSQLRDRSSLLLAKLVDEGARPDFIEEAKQLCEDMAAAGSTTSSPDQRMYLREDMRYWAATISLMEDKTYSTSRLEPHSALRTDMFDELMIRSESLLTRLVDDGEKSSELIEEMKQLCEDMAAAGREITDRHQRHRLHTSLAFWGVIVRQETGEFYIPPRLPDV